MRLRTKNRLKNRSNPLATIGLLFAMLVSLAAAAGVIYGVLRYADLTRNLPPPDLLETLLDPGHGTLRQPTRIYDQTGEVVLWEFKNPRIAFREYGSITDGNILFFQDVSEDLINAVLASQDPDYLNKTEGFLESIISGQPDPIPAQLVEDLLLWQEADHPDYFVRTKILVGQIIARYGREKVLEWYLNNAYFGNQIYGIRGAAQLYFGKPAGQLDLAESALLAGVAKFPSLNPYDSPEAARENQLDILSTMYDAGLITRGELEGAIQKQLIYPDLEGADDQTLPGYVEYILKEAGGMIPREHLLRGGFKISSTLDGTLQGELQCTVRLMISRAYGQDPPLDPACQAARLLPRYTGEPLDAEQPLEIGLVFLDPLKGELLGLVAERGDRGQAVLDLPRNPGTLLTPFSYLNYFTQGFGPAALVWDIPLDEINAPSEMMHPGCRGECDYQGPVNIRTALVNDYLSPAHQLWQSQGSTQIEKTLGLFGFSVENDRCPDCEVFPGIPALDIIDLAQGYGVFVNQGVLRGITSGRSQLEIQPASIQNIEDLSGWWKIPEVEFVENKIISEQLAYLVNHILSDENARIHGDVYQIGRPAGVKTGYVPGGSSAWVIGYTPQTLTGVWSGGSAGSGEDSEHFIEISAAIWRAITQYTTRDQENSGWEMPPDVVALDVCYPSGLLVSENCPREVREIFIQGNEPQGADTLYRVLDINRETGLLASVFTPRQLIEEKVFLDFPSKAKGWADLAGIESPPGLYDLDDRGDGREGFLLSSPENLSFVSGRVRLVGSLPEQDFKSARLQYGQGMNPGAWLQIGADITSPALDVWLGSWDTTDLEDGVYALQLVLIQQDQEIDQVSLIVSVDNTPPQISLKPDLSNMAISYRAGKQMLLEAVFENSSEIRLVEFYLDGRLIGSRSSPPFIHPWMVSPGNHQLLLKAVDLAGNRGELELEFEVAGD